MDFKFGEIVIYLPTCEKFEIEGIALNGKLFLKLPGRMDKRRHAKIPQPVELKNVKKYYESKVAS